MENDYNNPIKESEFNFLQYSDDGHCKRLRFTYKGQYFQETDANILKVIEKIKQWEYHMQDEKEIK